MTNLKAIFAGKVDWCAIRRSQAALLLRGRPLPSMEHFEEVGDGRIVARRGDGTFMLGQPHADSVAKVLSKETA